MAGDASFRRRGADRRLGRACFEGALPGYRQGQPSHCLQCPVLTDRLARSVWQVRSRWVSALPPLVEAARRRRRRLQTGVEHNSDSSDGEGGRRRRQQTGAEHDGDGDEGLSNVRAVVTADNLVPINSGQFVALPDASLYQEGLRVLRKGSHGARTRPTAFVRSSHGGACALYVVQVLRCGFGGSQHGWNASVPPNVLLYATMDRTEQHLGYMPLSHGLRLAPCWTGAA